MDDQNSLVSGGINAVGGDVPNSGKTPPANYTSLFAWPRTVSPGALNDNTGPLAYLHEIHTLAMSLEAGGNPDIIRPLQARRPDIGDLGMDDIGLKQAVPSLRLVIEQLTRHVRRHAPSASVEHAVSLAEGGLAQPFHAAWEQVKAVLRHRKVSLWETLRKSDADYPNFTFGHSTSEALHAAMTLSSGLSPELQAALTTGPETAKRTADTLRARARHLANVPGEDASSATHVRLTKEDRLRRCLGLSRKQLRQMIAVYEPGEGSDEGRTAVRESVLVSKTRTASGATFGARFINQGKEALSLSVPEGAEPRAVTINGLTEAHVDRMVRMLRLHRATGLSFGDLDMLLAAAMTAAGQQDDDFHITSTTLRALGLFQHLRDAYGVTAAQFATFIDSMPTGMNGREPAFYDTVFNPSHADSRQSSVLKIDDEAFDHEESDGAGAQTVAQLAQAMRVDEATVRWALARIVNVQKLERPTRSLAVVSACYRLLVLPQVFGIKVRELRTFLQALNRSTPTVMEQLAGIPSLGAIAATADAATTATTATAPATATATTTPATTAATSTPTSTTPSTDTTSTDTAPTAETTILDVIAMAMNVADWATGHQLDVGVLCAFVQAAEPAPVPARWIDAATRAMEQREDAESATTVGEELEAARDDAAVRIAFQQAFQLTDTNLAGPLLAWAGVTVGTFVESLERLRRPADGTQVPAASVQPDDIAMWQDLEKRAVAALLFRLSAAGLTAMTAHPAWFNLQNESGEGMRALDFTTLYQLTRYRDWIAALPKDTGKAGGEDQAIEYLSRVNTERALTQAQTAAMLARFTGWELGDIESVTDYIDGKTVPGTAEDLRDIDLIMRLHDLARATHVGIDALLDINDLKFAAEYAPFATAAATLLGGCDKEDAPIVEGIHNEAYRDALVGWLIEHGIAMSVDDTGAPSDIVHVTDASELSDYLLIDVMTGHEPQTSRVAAAIASVQTYVHRILTNLEPGHDDNVVATAALRERWTDAQHHYGRWQLLAKIRNYPENYIDPTRRRRKTSQYADLENLLAQGKLNESDIQAALFDYLTKFEASANIQPLTAYHDGVDPLHDTYHIIGKSNVSPAAYFWRTLDMSLRAPDDTTSALGFSEWEPMSVVPGGIVAQTRLPEAKNLAPAITAERDVLTQAGLAEDPRTVIDAIRPVIIDGQRYAVWMEHGTAGMPMGSEQKTSPYFEFRLCYSVRKLDGLWSAPNVLKTLNGYGPDLKYLGNNGAPPTTIPVVSTNDTSRAGDNAFLKTKDFLPGLIVMVNAKGHRKYDPWLTVIIYQSAGKIAEPKLDKDYYIASWDKLFLEERSLDTGSESGASAQTALVNEWMVLFNDPRIVQHQYIGNFMKLAEVGRDTATYAISTPAAAQRVTDTYYASVSRPGTGDMDVVLDERQDFLEITATFDGVWMASGAAPGVEPVGERLEGSADVTESQLLGKTGVDPLNDRVFNVKVVVFPKETVGTNLTVELRAPESYRGAFFSFRFYVSGKVLQHSGFTQSLSDDDSQPKANILSYILIDSALEQVWSAGQLTVALKLGGGSRDMDVALKRAGSQVQRIEDGSTSNQGSASVSGAVRPLEGTLRIVEDLDNNVIRNVKVTVYPVGTSTRNVTFELDADSGSNSDKGRDIALRLLGSSNLIIARVSLSADRQQSISTMSISAADLTDLWEKRQARIDLHTLRGTWAEMVELTEKTSTQAPSTEKTTTPGTARLVIRGGVANEKGADTPKKISLTYEDEFVMKRPEFAGIKTFIEGNSEDAATFRSALAVSRRPSDITSDKVRIYHWYDFLMSNYEYVENKRRLTTSELIDGEARELTKAVAAISVPNAVDIRQAVVLKRHHPGTYARLMASAMVAEQVLAEQTFVLNGKPAEITASFPVNLDIAKYVFTLEVYANDDTQMLGQLIRSYELRAPSKDERDDRAPTTWLVRNAVQAHYLDMSEVNKKIPVAAHRRQAIRLNTLFGKRLAALSFVSPHQALDWEAQLIGEPRLEPGGDLALVDFRGANGLYFWELFFHVPMLLAWQLRGTRQFREAFDWCARHLFDPYDTVGRPGVYVPPFWHTRPLVNVPPTLAIDADAPSEDVEDHAYAEPERFRKAMFMFLVECWRQQGDDAYRQLTRDGVNEAINRYRMALRLIGPLPESLTVATTSLGKLKDVEENPFLPPVNVALTQGRDLVNHRLFNIRHGLTIDGKVMDLALYDGEDDYASLGDARTGMASGSRRVGPLNVPAYRFRHVLPIAREAVATLVDMGRQLFHTYEEEYNAGLSVLQQANVIKLSDFTVQLESLNVDAARAERDTLLATRRMVEQRRDYYAKLDNDGHHKLESAAFALGTIGTAATLAAIPFDMLGGAVEAFPKIFGASNGGAKLEGQLLATGAALGCVGTAAMFVGGELRWEAAFERDRAGWRHEANQADRELELIDRQIAENDIRARSASVTLANEKARQVLMREEYVFMTTGFAIGPTYVWMISRLSEIYASAYDAVMSLCLAAQDSWRYETGDFVRRFVKPGAWLDNWRGQLAGEALQRDLLEMEAAYLHRHERRMHVRKVVRLTELNKVTADDLAAELIAGHPVHVSLPSAVYDRDFPGHYLRQIVSVSVAFRMKTPDVVQGVAAELTQVTNKILLAEDEDGAAFLYGEHKTEKPDSVLADVRQTQRVALSSTHPVIDMDGYSGLYSLIFGDDRYLPFEGTGAISTWMLSCPGNKDDLKNVFMSGTQAGDTACRLEDIVLTIDYLAASGSEAFIKAMTTRSTAANGTAPAALENFVRPRLAKEASGPVVVIPPHPDLPVGTTLRVVFKSGDTVLHEADAQSWDGTALAVPVPPAVLTSRAGKPTTVLYMVASADDSATSEGSVAVIPAARAGTYPRPQVAGIQPNRSTVREGASDGAIDLRDVRAGAAVTVAPWDYIQTGQRVWLRCVGTKENGESTVRDLYVPATGITEADMTAGVSAVIPRDYLQGLGDYASLEITMKVALNGGETEATATAFPSLTLDIPKCSEVAVSFGKSVEWRSAPSQLRKYDLGYVALVPEVGPVSLTLEGTQRLLHIACTDDAGATRTIHCAAERTVVTANGGWRTYCVDSAREAAGRDHYYTTSFSTAVDLSRNPDLPPGHYRGQATLQMIGWQVPRIVESIRVELDFVAPPLVLGVPSITTGAKGEPGVAIPANPRVPAGTTIRVIYQVDTGKEVASDPIGWNGSATTLPVPAATLAAGRGKAVTVVYAVDIGGVETRSDKLVVTFPVAATPTWPEPVVAAVRANHALDRRDVPDGAEVTIAPWPYMHEGQAVWLRCVGTKEDGKAITRDLRGPSQSVTGEELTAGVRATIPLDYLNALGDRGRFSVVMKAGGNDATGESVPSPFPALSLDVPKCASLAAKTTWIDCDFYNHERGELGFVAIAADVGPVALTQDGTTRSLHVPVSKTEGKTVDAVLSFLRWVSSGGRDKPTTYIDGYGAPDSPSVRTVLQCKWESHRNSTLPSGVYRGRVIVHAIAAKTGRVDAVILVEVNAEHVGKTSAPVAVPASEQAATASEVYMPPAPASVSGAAAARTRLQSIYKDWANLYREFGGDRKKALQAIWETSQKIQEASDPKVEEALRLTITSRIQNHYNALIHTSMADQLCDVEPSITRVDYVANNGQMDVTITGTVPVKGGVRNFVETVSFLKYQKAIDHERTFTDAAS